MQLSVTFRHMESSDALKDYVSDKVSRVEKYLDASMEAHVVLSVEKFRHTADVTIISNGLNIKGQEQTDDMYSAIDLVTDKIEKQAKRFRQKQKKHKPNKKGRELTMNIIAPEPDDEFEGAPQIIKTEQVHVKPMDIDEAVMQLNLSQDKFIVFTNAETETLNVLYRRQDGNYGLIESVCD